MEEVPVTGDVATHVQEVRFTFLVAIWPVQATFAPRELVLSILHTKPN